MIKKIIITIALALAWSALANAQSGVYQIHPPAQAGTTMRVCGFPATGNPCSNTSSIFSDSALSVPLANPLVLGSGTVIFYVSPGTVTIQLSGATNDSYVATIPSTSGGGGGGTCPVGAAGNLQYTNGTNCASTSELNYNAGTDTVLFQAGTQEFLASAGFAAGTVGAGISNVIQTDAVGGITLSASGSTANTISLNANPSGAINISAGTQGILLAGQSTNIAIDSTPTTLGVEVGGPTGGFKGSGTINAQGLFVNGVAVGTGNGTVTSVGFTGGLISVANPTTTPAFTVAGTSGGVPYFSSTSTWASSAAGTVNTLMKWGGAGNPPIASSVTDNGITVATTEPISTSAVGALSQSAVTLTGAPITGGNGSTTFPLLYLNSGATPVSTFSGNGTGLGMNLPSGFSGNFLHFFVNNSARLFIDSNGTINAGGQYILNATTGSVQAKLYQSITNCSSSASPAVCAAAEAGSVAIPAGAAATLQVNTTAVTANSQIFLTIDEGLGTKLGVTCNTTVATLTQPVVTARTAASNFTIQEPATTTTNPVCVSYLVFN